MDNLIKRGAQTFRAGKIEEARELLTKAIKQNPDSEAAWGWLYNVTNNDKERLHCLKQVLRINPNNEKANKLFNKLIDEQAHLEDNQPQVSKNTQPNQKQVALNKKTSNKKKGRNSFIILVFLVIFLCISGIFVVDQILKPDDINTVNVRVLSAQEVFNVSAVDAVKADGYTVSSAVCEVVSPINYQPSLSIFNGQLVFHSFRLTGQGLESEIVVLFASNHTAKNGNGLVFSINDGAIDLNQGFSAGSSLNEPITVNTAGAQTALDCAQKAGEPPILDLGNFNVEDWRQKTIEKFGPEQTNSDGSKDDYVRFALAICDLSKAERETMQANLGSDYKGSFQEFVIETFCPRSNNN